MGFLLASWGVVVTIGCLMSLLVGCGQSKMGELGKGSIGVLITNSGGLSALFTANLAHQRHGKTDYNIVGRFLVDFAPLALLLSLVASPTTTLSP